MPGLRTAMRYVALGVAALGGLAACGGPPVAAPPPPTSAPAAAPTTAGPPPTTAGPPPATRAGTTVLYGVTVDDTSRLSETLAALRALPVRPTVRVVFGAAASPGEYLPAVRQLAGSATVMGELLDSSEETQVPVDAMASRTRRYMAVLGRYVSIWEVGNEVNGNWLGPYPDVASRLTAAYNQVSEAGGLTALTLYANQFGPDHCGDGPAEATPEQFSSRYVPAPIRDHLNYVFLSYYPSQCGRLEPGNAQLRAEMQALHALYPSASLGLGEVGLPAAATTATTPLARQVMAWAYSLDPGLAYYVGGYFWWYAAEDALGPGRPLASSLVTALRTEKTALGGA